VADRTITIEIRNLVTAGTVTPPIDAAAVLAACDGVDAVATRHGLHSDGVCRTIAIRTCGGCPFFGSGDNCRAWQHIDEMPIVAGFVAPADTPPAACPLRRGPVTLEVDRG
jgi:hypothetical protein